MSELKSAGRSKLFGQRGAAIWFKHPHAPSRCGCRGESDASESIGRRVGDSPTIRATLVEGACWSTWPARARDRDQDERPHRVILSQVGEVGGAEQVQPGVDKRRERRLTFGFRLSTRVQNAPRTHVLKESAKPNCSAQPSIRSRYPSTGFSTRSNPSRYRLPPTTGCTSARRYS